MSDDNITTFNILLTRVIAKLYGSHPATIELEALAIWEPRLKRSDDKYETKANAANGTLTWLHDNGFINGRVQHFGDMIAIKDAQLTAHGYRIASRPEQNMQGAPTIGQIAIEAVSDTASDQGRELVTLVAERFTGGLISFER
jgi:hypothetical protein